MQLWKLRGILEYSASGTWARARLPAQSRAVIEETVWACADLKCQEEEHISPVSGWAPGRLRAVSQTLPEWPRRSQCFLSISSATVLNQTHSQARGCQRLSVMPGRPREVLSAIAGLFLAETVSCPVWSLDLPDSEHATFLPEAKEMFHPRRGPKRKIA